MEPYDPPAHTLPSYRCGGVRRACQDRLRRCRALPTGEAEINVRKRARYAGEDCDPLQRGKAGAEVEFGSQLLLGECVSGVIVDWELVDGKPEADTKMLKRSLDRMKATAVGAAIKEVGGDRGFDSQANRDLLEAGKVYNGICPKAPSELKKRMKQERFVKLQRRRSQTEARIAVFKCNGSRSFPLRFSSYLPASFSLS